MEIHGDCEQEGWLNQMVGTGGGLVVDPPESLLTELVDTVAAESPAEPLRLLLSPEAVDLVSTDFLLETRVAGTVERSELRLREADAGLADRVVLTDHRVGLLVGVADQVGLFPVDADPLLAGLRERYEAAWEEARPYSPRAPSRESLYRTAEDHLPGRFAGGLERAIDGASTLNWGGTPRPPEVALVVAARVRAQHYDACKWAEDVGFTSRSTIARTKSALETEGVIEVEKVPQERGRPRQRLVVADDRVATENVDAENLVPTLRRIEAN